MVTKLSICSFIVLIVSLLFVNLPKVFDFNQCSRMCLVKFGGSNTYNHDGNNQIDGSWSIYDRIRGKQECSCEKWDTKTQTKLNLGVISRLYPEEESGYPYIWRDTSVCGLDGNVYKSPEEAKRKAIPILHCGPHCGRCSNVHDLRRYREIGPNVSKVVGPCILLYLVGGHDLDVSCMSQRAQFTPACNECWTEDHGCLAVHCFYDCVFKARKMWERLLSLNNPNDVTSNDDSCLVCMEKYCSAPFIRACGVNRRSAGVITDVGRIDREICKLPLSF
jgi:hypothetical protein